MDLDDRLAAHVRGSPTLMAVLRTAARLDLPDWMVMSGAVYQTVWNALTGRHPDYGIQDYDLVYFDPDLSAEAEAATQARVAAAFPPGLAEKVEVCNQARVHLWFPQAHGRPYPPLRDTADALTRALATAHAVGVRLDPAGRLTVAAPFGLADIFALVLRPAPGCGSIKAHLAKAAGAKARWPELTVLDA